MDIMGSGGFLLSNYQEDFLDDFVPGEDFVFYESEDDFVHKIDYYLAHDNERRQIIANCSGKMQAGTYLAASHRPHTRDSVVISRLICKIQPVIHPFYNLFSAPLPCMFL